MDVAGCCQEVIMHAAVAGVDRFLMWNTHAIGDDNPVVSRSLDELESVIGALQGKTGTRSWVHRELANWATGYMLSATQINGEQCVWRFTPQGNFTMHHHVSATQTTPAGYGGAPAVQLTGMVNSNTGAVETVTIPSAKLLEPNRRAVAAPAGLWLLQKRSNVSGAQPCPFTVS
jgi:hypothetical protein